jgi:hypothetical protein
MSFQTEVCNKGVETTSNCDYCPTITDQANIVNYFSTTIYPTGCEGKVTSHVTVIFFVFFCKKLVVVFSTVYNYEFLIIERNLKTRLMF